MVKGENIHRPLNSVSIISTKRTGVLDKDRKSCALWAPVALMLVVVSGAVGAPLPSTTSLETSSSTSVLGQAVTLTATVYPSIATGRATWYDGVTVLGASALTQGQAEYTTTLLESGVRQLKAFYSGDSTYQGSTSKAVSQTVSALPSKGFGPALTAGTVPSAGPVAIR